MIHDLLNLIHGIFGGGDQDRLGARIGDGIDGGLLFKAVAHAVAPAVAAPRRLCRGPRTARAPASGFGRTAEVWIREKGEQFGGHLGAIRIGEEEEPDLDGVFLRNIQLDNDVGDGRHQVRRRADQDGVVLVVGDGVDVNSRPLAFIGGGAGAAAAPAAPPSYDGSERVDRRRLSAGAGIGENILQLSGDGLGIGVGEEKDLQVAIAGAVERRDDLRKSADVRLGPS